jgi:predicted TIM-barrel fold metal-dependent hydrolase
MSGHTSVEIRKQLTHPVIDVDGHQVELEPLMLDYIREVGGAEAAAAVHKRFCDMFAWYGMSPQQRRSQRVVRPPWGLAANADALAAYMLPGYFRKQMDATGIDFSVVYPTMGIAFMRRAPAELRSITVRAINRYYADAFRPYGDRLTAAAIIPMTSPQEAIAELDHAVKELGLKVVVIDCAVPRQLEAASKVDEPLRRYMTWLDTFGIDSEHDYDPFWARCLELGVSPTAHMAGMWGTRTSPSSYVHNHLGMFGAAGEALCKSLFLAGVSYRFPKLQIAFLEGGAGWACSLFADMIEHWEKRNLEAVSAYDPSGLDKDHLVRMLREHGGPRVEKFLDRPLDETFRAIYLLSGWVPEAGWQPRDPSVLDEFARCPVKSEEDLRDHFVPNFFFGCEAEDPSVAWAMDGRTLPMGARLQTVFGSDIGHWDVTDMTGILAEAYEHVEHGHLDENLFRDWMFTNPVRLHGRNNPAFFKGTVVEREAAALLSSEPR